MKAIMTKRGQDYIVTIYNHNNQYVTSMTYPYVSRETGQKAALNMLKRLGVDVSGMSMVKTSEITWETTKA